jgi:arsenate reductase (thioredoxin)
MKMTEKEFISRRLQGFVGEITGGFDAIPEARREVLLALATYVKTQLTSDRTMKFIFICTHNSRRSHFSQIWAQTAAYYYGIDLECYSGGTEATAFNSRAVEAVRRAGLSVTGDESSTNPVYEVKFSGEAPPIVAFSKRYSDQFNPQSGYAAVMTCSDADENCPVVFGADTRFSLTYIDPKESDDTIREIMTYDLRCKQIAAEMFFLMLSVKR